MTKIKISSVKQIREMLNLDQIIIFGLDKDFRQHVATHGKTREDANNAALFGNNLKKVLNWPPNLCEQKPLERKCENCDFWVRKQFYPGPGQKIPNNWPGDCMHEPTSVKRLAEDRACAHFEPKF